MRTVFCRPCRGWNFFCGNLPTVSPWATICRASGALLVLAAILFGAASVKAQTTNGLSDAEIKGRELARHLCEAKPETNYTLNGVMKIKDGNGHSYQYFVQFSTTTQNPDSIWLNQYGIGDSTNIFCSTGSELNNSKEVVSMLLIKHCKLLGSPAEYLMTRNWSLGAGSIGLSKISDGDLYSSIYQQSDFWLCDLGLEFFHWPQQKILPKTTNLKRGRDYTLLESTNPNPPTNGYSRVLSWIDKETGGILEAEAYDANGKLLKEFEPKSFKKINGQWELQEMEIRNVQTGSRTRLEFDLKKD